MLDVVCPKHIEYIDLGYFTAFKQKNLVIQKKPSEKKKKNAPPFLHVRFLTLNPFPEVSGIRRCCSLAMGCIKRIGDTFLRALGVVQNRALMGVVKKALGFC